MTTSISSCTRYPNSDAVISLRAADQSQCRTEGPNKWEELSLFAFYNSEIRPYEVTIDGMSQGAGWARGYFLVNNAKGKGSCP